MSNNRLSDLYLVNVYREKFNYEDKLIEKVIKTFGLDSTED